MILATAQGAAARLGRPSTTIEYGTLDDRYVRRWAWFCGCKGELIGSELIELVCCQEHRRESTQPTSA